jgi:hypothetical protein
VATRRLRKQDIFSHFEISFSQIAEFIQTNKGCLPLLYTAGYTLELRMADSKRISSTSDPILVELEI